MIKAGRPKTRPRPTELEALAALVAEAAMCGISFGELIRNYHMGFYEVPKVEITQIAYALQKPRVRVVTEPLFNVDFGRMGEEEPGV
jgi:hypothetical protein